MAQMDWKTAVGGTLLAVCVESCTPARLVAKPTPGPEAPLKAATDSLVGDYALRITYFHTGNVQLTFEEYLVARVAEQGDELSMTLHSCEWSNRAGSDPFITLDGALLPERVLKVTIDDCADGNAESCEWSAEPPDQRVFTTGFSEEEAPGCATARGARIATTQPWLRDIGTCFCSRSPSVPFAEVEADDCRVQDPDDDGLPGFSVMWSSDGLSFSAQLAYQATSSFSQGTIDPSGEHVAHEMRTDHLSFFSCSPISCNQNSTHCGIDASRAHFVPFSKLDLDRIDTSDSSAVCDVIKRDKSQIWKSGLNWGC